MSIYNPTVEERAFLYQEAQDLEPLMKDLGSLSVVIEEVTSKSRALPKSKFRVTFMVAPESVGMRVQAVDTNIYDAAIAAKAEALKQLNAIVNALPRAPAGANGATGIPREFLH